MTVFDGHVWDDGVVTKEATVSEKGEINYTCTRCGETKAEEIPMLNPIVIDSPSGAWTKDEDSGLTFKSNASFYDFISVLVDGEEIDASNYELREGSIVVILKPEYLETLSTGTHTLGIKSVSGIALTEFAIELNEETTTAPEETTPPTTEETTPPTTEETSSPTTEEANPPTKEETSIPTTNGTSEPNESELPDTGVKNDVLIWIVLLYASAITATVIGAGKFKKKR